MPQGRGVPLPLIEKPTAAVPIRAQLEKFAADSGLQI